MTMSERDVRRSKDESEIQKWNSAEGSNTNKVSNWENLNKQVRLGAGQTKVFRPLLDVFFPSIYRIFRASHNANRWCIINQMFANSRPVDARVKNYR